MKTFRMCEDTRPERTRSDRSDDSERRWGARSWRGDGRWSGKAVGWTRAPLLPHNSRERRQSIHQKQGRSAPDRRRRWLRRGRGSGAIGAVSIVRRRRCRSAAQAPLPAASPSKTGRASTRTHWAEGRQDHQGPPGSAGLRRSPAGPGGLSSQNSIRGQEWIHRCTCPSRASPRTSCRARARPGTCLSAGSLDLAELLEQLDHVLRRDADAESATDTDLPGSARRSPGRSAGTRSGGRAKRAHVTLGGEFGRVERRLNRIWRTRAPATTASDAW